MRIEIGTRVRTLLDQGPDVEKYGVADVAAGELGTVIEDPAGEQYGNEFTIRFDSANPYDESDYWYAEYAQEGVEWERVE